jgi:hypothetical protein
MALQGRVKFIRKNGHVIPIRQPALTEKGKTDAKNAVAGAALVASGVATGLASGHAYRKTVSKATSLSARAFNTLEKLRVYKGKPMRDLGHFAKKQQNISKAAKLSHNAFKSSRAIGRLAPGVRIGGQLAASTLIGIGAGKLYKAARKNADGGEVSAVTGTATTASFLAGSHGRAGIRAAFKDAYVAAYPTIRKMKGKFHL